MRGLVVKGEGKSGDGCEREEVELSRRAGIRVFGAGGLFALDLALFRLAQV